MKSNHQRQVLQVLCLTPAFYQHRYLVKTMTHRAPNWEFLKNPIIIRNPTKKPIIKKGGKP